MAAAAGSTSKHLPLAAALLVTFLAHEHPTALPVARAEIETAARAREQAPPPVPASVAAEMAEPQTGGLPGEPEPQPEAAVT